MTTPGDRLGIVVDVEGIEELRRRGEIREVLAPAMNLAGLLISERAKEVTPVNKNRRPGEHRGRLSAGWTVKTTASSQNVVTRIGNNVEYGPYVNFGTGTFVGRGAYVIVPRRASVLHFFVGSREVFARRVVHPGIRGQHFAERALDDRRGAALELIRRRIQDHLDGRSA